MSVGPLVASLAAGNRTMIKMSEYTPHTSALFKEIIESMFPEEMVSVITGEADVAADFSQRPFDHLLFTGSTSVGKLVMRAAAENIAFGKAFNAGQTCVAPDYVLCPADRVQAFVDEFRARFAEMYPSLRDNDDYTAIINERQYDRLQGYLEDARSKGAELVEINRKPRRT